MKQNIDIGLLMNNFKITERDLEEFCLLYKDRPIKTNKGGMGAPDMFSLWLTLKRLNPECVVESGVFKGQSTWLIRNTLPECEIICLDPEIKKDIAFVDKSKKTTYYCGSDFIDFSQLEKNKISTNSLIFFDDHVNAFERVIQCYEKQCKLVFFNDNYPVGCGSHLTIEHVLGMDERFEGLNDTHRSFLQSIVSSKHTFPNICRTQIKTGEGVFDCESIYDESDLPDQLDIFSKEGSMYRWNTLIELNIERIL